MEVRLKVCFGSKGSSITASTWFSRLFTLSAPPFVHIFPTPIAWLASFPQTPSYVNVIARVPRIFDKFENIPWGPFMNDVKLFTKFARCPLLILVTNISYGIWKSNSGKKSDMQEFAIKSGSNTQCVRRDGGSRKRGGPHIFMCRSLIELTKRNWNWKICPKRWPCRPTIRTIFFNNDKNIYKMEWIACWPSEDFFGFRNNNFDWICPKFKFACFPLHSENEKPLLP